MVDGSSGDVPAGREAWLEAMGGACCVVDAAGRVQAANAAWRALEADPGPAGPAAAVAGAPSLDPRDGSATAALRAGLRTVAAGERSSFDQEHVWRGAGCGTGAAGPGRMRTMLRPAPGAGTAGAVLVQALPACADDGRETTAWSDRLADPARALGMAVWRVDPRRGLLHLPAGGARLAGLADRDSVPLDAWIARIHPEDRAAFEALFGQDRSSANAAAATAAAAFWFRIEDEAAAYRRVLCLSGDAVGAPDDAAVVQGVFLDVTDRWLAPARHWGPERRFQRLFERIAERIAILDRNGRYRYVNKAFEDGVGTPRAEILGRTPADVLGSAAWERLEPYLQRAFAGEAVSFEVDLVLRDGSDYYASVSYLPDREPSGAVGSVYAIVHDIGKHVERERRLLREKEAAEQANRFKSNFLACVSHDLRTPLNAILGFSEIIRDQHLGPAAQLQYRQYAGHIHDSGEILLKTVNELLDLSAIESGKRDFVIEAVDFGAELERAARALARMAEEKGVVLTVTRSGRPRPVETCALAVAQIAANLLTNAVKFTDAGGAVVATLSYRPDGVELSVRDTGCGIPADKLKRVLDPFARGGANPTTAQPGWGLGLSICQGLVDALGGRLTLSSAVGEGTEAVVSLPYAPSPAARSAEAIETTTSA
ncbi:MAG: PAS domain-containing protein [Alphaproteobacteria bacterium]|nr:PAS domain-containing protein [Alphaproteobacteria bacterium]